MFAGRARGTGFRAPASTWKAQSSCARLKAHAGEVEKRGFLNCLTSQESQISELAPGVVSQAVSGNRAETEPGAWHWCTHEHQQSFVNVQLLFWEFHTGTRCVWSDHPIASSNSFPVLLQLFYPKLVCFWNTHWVCVVLSVWVWGRTTYWSIPLTPPLPACKFRGVWFEFIVSKKLYFGKRGISNKSDYLIQYLHILKLRLCTKCTSWRGPRCLDTL